MIEVSYFGERLEEIQELTTGFPLRMTLKNRLYDKLLHYKQEQFDYACDEILKTGEKLTYNTLLKYIKLAPVKREKHEKKKSITVTECNERVCSICKVDDCQVMGREVMQRMDMLFDKDMHEKAILELKELFPDVNWEPETKPIKGVLLHANGTEELIYA